MNKKEAAAVLEEIAILLELSGENPFKARSYANVARALEQHPEDIETLARDKRLREIKGVGDALEQKLTELAATGKLEYHQKLRAKFPESLFDLFTIPGLGAKRIKTLYEDLRICSLAELEYACLRDKLTTLKGFGPKMQQNVLDGIGFAKRHEGLFHFHKAQAEAARLHDWLARDRSVVRIAIAGSLRRHREVVKDIDIVASSRKPAALMERFVRAERVAAVTSHGETKSSVVLESGLAADLRVVSDPAFPYALAHFTGSKAHNVAMRQRAKDLGLKLNEYGLFRGDAKVRCKNEAAIFKRLGLPYLPPELREDMGEFDAAQVPRLVERSDLVGLIHCHTTYSDGRATLDQMAEAARKRGYRYLVVADHSQSAAYAGGLTPKAVAKQHEEIERLNKTRKNFTVLKGIESDIRGDGSLDYDEALLKTFDLIIASVHSKLDMAEAEATKRTVKAVEHPYTDVLGHPTGRLLLVREGYPLDLERVFDACLANDVAIEINANPHRFDLDWRHIKRAKDKGVRFCIGPDAHDVEGIDDVDYGVGIARKGWLEPAHLINCMSLAELAAWRKKR